MINWSRVLGRIKRLAVADIGVAEKCRTSTRYAAATVTFGVSELEAFRVGLARKREPIGFTRATALEMS